MTRAAAVLAALALAASGAHAASERMPKAARAAAREAAPGKRALPERVPLAQQAPAPKPLALVGAHVHPVVGDDVPDGLILLKGGRIEAVLPSAARTAESLEADGYEILDARGRHAYPGLVAAGAPGIGLSNDAWVGGAQDAVVNALAPAFNAWHDDVELMASAGITTAVVYRAGGGEKAGALVGRADALKMSHGEPRGASLRSPCALIAGSAILTASGRAGLREQVEAARKARSGHDWDPKKARYPALLLEAAEGRLPVLAQADSSGEIVGVLDAARELGFRLVLYHPTDAWTLAPRLAEEGHAVVQHVRTSWGKPRADRRTSLGGGWRFDAASRLVRAGVEVAVSPYDDDIVLWGVAGRDLLNLTMEAAHAQRAGLDPQQALESITLAPARLYGLDDRVGSLERGKDADVILTDGELLDYRTLVRETIVNGRVAYRAEDHRYWDWILERRKASLGETPAPAR